MGSSCIDNDNNKNISKNNKTINIHGCSDETHDSLKYQNNYNNKIIEENSEHPISKQISQINENINITTNINTNNNNINTTTNNNNYPNIIISEQTVLISAPSINEEHDYNIIIIKESDKEKNILNKLYSILQEKEINKKSDVIIKYNNGEEYIGELDEENYKNGRGIQIFNNNNIYYGYWENNKMNGIGKMIKFNQKINNLDIIFNDNSMPFYFGEWKNNLEDGNGEEIWIDKSIYKGGYKEGLKEGKGNLLLSDGTEYNGDFYQGKIEGKGKIIYKDGRIYEGNWLNNKMNGEGQFNWPDGRMYKGNYLNNYKNGYGEFFWPDGKIYKGMWVNGKQNGKGKLYNKEYDIWINGIWKDGKRIKEKNE